MGFLLLAVVCFALIYGIFRAIRSAEDTAHEKKLYYTAMPFFVHWIAPGLIAVIGFLILVGLASLALFVLR